MQLHEFVSRYLAVRPVSVGYAHTIQKRTGKLIAFAGRSELVAVFNEATLNGFLETLHHLSPFTQNKYRQDLLAIWRAAADEDRIPYPQPRRIKRVRTLPQVIECYVEHEARALVLAGEHLRGAYPNGVARRHYWPAIIRAAWDSGLRRGDLWRLTTGQIRKDRSALIVQSKTKKVQPCRFYQSTIAAIERAGGHLAWPLCTRCFGQHFDEIQKASGVLRGTFRWLRRGSGSRIDADHPGTGHEHLGNGRQVFDAHYNARLNAAKRPLPPEL